MHLLDILNKFRHQKELDKPLNVKVFNLKKDRPAN